MEAGIKKKRKRVSNRLFKVLRCIVIIAKMCPMYGFTCLIVVYSPFCLFFFLYLFHVIQE